jgi:hypothetical protein
VCSALTSLVTIAFFIIGIADGSVSSFNFALWLGLLTVVAASLALGYALYARGKVALAVVALSVTAAPGVLAALFLAIVLLTGSKWN